MRILSNGNVGIGTTSPGAVLDVTAANTSYAAIIRNTTAGGDYLKMIGDSGNTVFEFGSGGTGGDGFLNIYSDNSQKIQITADTISYFNAGNVGIGTTSPSQLLHLNVSSGAVYTRIQNNNNSLYLGLESGGIAQVSSDISSLKVMANTYTSFETSGSERMRITNAGYVGIGTTNPRSVLDIVSDNNAVHLTLRGRALDNEAQMEFYNNAGTTRYSTIGGTSNYTYINTVGSTPIWFGTNGTERVRITSGGNVGIGTTSPAFKLDVNGDIAIPSSNYIQYYTGASYYGRIQLWNSSTGDMTFQNASGGTSHMIFLPQGNVGIGTSTPIAKLDVEGDFQLLNANYNSYSSSVSGTTTLATIPTSSYNGVFFDFVAFSGSNQRAGTLIGNWRSGNVQYTEYSTPDIGSTAAALTMSVALSGANALVQSVSAPGWAIKATYRTV